MNDFNLISDAWIPVLRPGGRHDLASLSDVFSGSEIIDLNADPCERIALMRLLMAISHRALDQAGLHPEEFTRSANIAVNLIQRVPAYLEERSESFYLGDANNGFLRLPGVTCAKKPDKPTFEYLKFHKRQQTRVLTQADLAIGIILFQTCYLGGTGTGNVYWNGEQVSTESKRSGECPPSMEEGPLYAFIVGSNLLDTLSRNLLPKSRISGELGVPIWEAVPKVKGDAGIKNATSTFLGRMVPISFSIVFSQDFEHMGFCQAPYSYRNATQDPWLTYVPEKKDSSGVMRISRERSIWRELPAITSVPVPGQRRGSLLLQESRNLSGSQVWAGGLAKYQANVLMLVESRFDLTESMFESLRDEGFLMAFLEGDKVASRLRYAVKTYIEASARLNPKGTRPLVAEAQMRYWNRLDNSKGILFGLMDKQESPTVWTSHCLRTARSVFTEVCDPNTAREFKALVHAQSKL